MTILNTKFVFLFLLSCVYFYANLSQSVPWFGPNNTYKCHCDNGCENDGSCSQNGVCQKGWFGFKCQYQDLATIENVIPNPELDNVTDRNDSTCLDQQYQELNVTWNGTYVFTWLRIVVNDTTLIPYINIEFTSPSHPSQNLACDNKRLYLVNQQTLDIKCNVTEKIQSVLISGAGVKSICSLYINGGRNVGLKQVTWQSTTYTDNGNNWFSSLAVNGNTDSDVKQNSCSHTNNEVTPTWSVRFNATEITRYVLYNRNEFQDRLKHFILEGRGPGPKNFSYNDTSDSEEPIYTVLDVSKTIVSNVTIIATNNNVGKFVTLCEVEIYGECPNGTWNLNCEPCPSSCPDNCHLDSGSCNEVCFGSMDPPDCKTGCENGGFGLNCSQRCPVNCLNNTCDRFIGTCQACEAGFTGETCNTNCDSYHWGESCQNNCSSNCQTETCDRFNGTCDSGCKAGYQLPDCTKVCIDGAWGINCTQNCSSNCKNESCNKTDGHCPDGCKAGYKSPNCTEDCDSYHWGESCQNNCSSNCQTETCDRFNGTCHSGCKAGYQLPNCTEECEPTKFGGNCTNDCSINCTHQHCHHVNGTCHTCIPGHRGEECDQYCNETTFGQNCSSTCSTKCTDQKCDPINGTCNACHPGYHGDLCNETCEPTTFGENCATNCSLNCVNQTCHKVNGSCHECYPGYRGEQCDQLCENTKYGQDCLKNCSINCTHQNCHHDNGSCISCDPGYHGDLCTEECSNKTYGHNCAKTCSATCKTKSSVTCHHITGQCLTECEDGYSGQFCENQDSGLALSQVGAIVGSIVAVILVAVLVAVGAILWKRRYQKKPEATKSDEVMHMDNIREKAGQDTAGDSTYLNVAGMATNTKIAVEALNKYIHSHTDAFFTEQYKKVPKPKNVTTEVAVSEENNNKNRYKNICPYDHSRVHLKINTNKSEGDYINASYVRDSHNDVKFIAAQGPFGAVVNDFVRMLWEQKVEKVVMLTNLIEEGKPKCDKYWPDSGNTAFGEITVKLKDTQILADYVIRKIELEKSDAPTQSLTHYHFTSWPDQGVPVTPWALVDFEQRVDINSSTAPVVVHCSAGVGRTGTFIALHNILSQAKETGSVDFYKTLVKLREDRFLMIQTPDQYIFLHKAAQAAIVSMGTTVIFNDSKTRMQHLLTKSISGMSNMEKEFQNICAICQNESNPKTNSEAIYQNTENVKVVDTKNRFESIIPKNCYRPYLGSDSKEFDDYINAVFVQGFYKKDQQILTQLPMPSTLIDFFRLVTQHRVSLIVAFEVDKRSTDQTIANYLPSQDKPITASPFSIRSMGIKGDNMWEEHTIKVINENTKAEHDVIHLKCKVLDPDARRLLSLVNKSRSYNALANGRIIYTCRDGATYSGLACVLSLLLDRIDHDTCLAIPLVVGSVKSIRPQVISTFEHYVMLHEALQSYNDTTAAYNNMEENFFPRFSSLKNKDFDESQAKEGNVYSNM